MHRDSRSRAKAFSCLAPTSLVAVGIIVATFFPWFGPKLSGVPHGEGFIVAIPTPAGTMTAWEASTGWTTGVILMSIATITLGSLSKTNRAGRATAFSLAVIAVGVSQAITILLFDRVGVSTPFRAESEIVEGRRVTLEFGLLGAGQAAFVLSLVVVALGAFTIFSARRRRARIATANSLDT